MRLLVLIVLAIFGCGWGGCALPRMVEMHVVGISEVPVVPGGARLAVRADGWRDSVEVKLRSPLKMQETVEWYAAELAREGWELIPSQDEAGKAGDSVWRPSANYYEARRERWHVGKTALLKEDLRLEVWFGGGTEVSIEIVGDYVWDWPSKAIVGFFGSLPGIAMRPLEDMGIGADEVDNKFIFWTVPMPLMGLYLVSYALF